MLQTHNKQNKSTMCGGGRRNGFSRGRRRAPCTDRMCVPREQTARGAILRGPESGGVGELPVWEGGGARSTEGRTEGEAARRTVGRAEGEGTRRTGGGSTEGSGEGAQRTAGGLRGGSTEGSGEDVCAPSSAHPCL